VQPFLERTNFREFPLELRTVADEEQRSVGERRTILPISIVSERHEPNSRGLCAAQDGEQMQGRRCCRDTTYATEHLLGYDRGEGAILR